MFYANGNEKYDPKQTSNLLKKKQQRNGTETSLDRIVNGKKQSSKANLLLNLFHIIRIFLNIMFFLHISMFYLLI